MDQLAHYMEGWLDLTNNNTIQWPVHNWFPLDGMQNEARCTSNCAEPPVVQQHYQQSFINVQLSQRHWPLRPLALHI